MSRGGAGRGQGRKPGSLTVKNRAIAERALADGQTPLEVMLDNMRFYHQASLKLIEQLLEHGAPPVEGEPQPDAPPNNDVIEALRQLLGFRKLAGEAARDAAPYLHPRLSSTVDDEPQNDFVPLAQRLEAYQRRDDLAAAGGNVVDITPRTGK
jgi:hypothetical protein